MFIVLDTQGLNVLFFPWVFGFDKLLSVNQYTLNPISTCIVCCCDVLIGGGCWMSYGM